MLIQNYDTYYPLNFGVNLNSPKLRYSRKDFFVKINGYGKNNDWADKIIEISDATVQKIRAGYSPESSLKETVKGVTEANQIGSDLYKQIYTGLLRTPRDGWESSGYSSTVLTDYSEGRYKVYKRRLDSVLKNPLLTPDENIAMSRPNQYSDIVHGDPYKINSSLDTVFKLCKKVFPKFVKEEVKPENIEEINAVIAEIRWILAHSTPWYRGSDAIANVFMRAMYKAVGIKSYPLKKGISLDLEAYCTELKDYIAKFTRYFTKPPEIAE